MKNWDEMTDEEKNLWIAVNVMGLYVSDGYYQISCPDGIQGCCVWHGRKVPDYINNISPAYEVVEKLRPTHIYELADFGRNTHPDKPHYAWFHPINRGSRSSNDYQARSKTLSEAICKAAYLLSYNSK